MIALGSPSDVSRISNPYIRALIELRFRQLGTFNAEDGLLIVVESADTLDELERVSGCALLHDPHEGVRFPDPAFSHSFDILEKHYENGKLYCFEAHVDTSDDGIGTTLFIPADGVDADLLAMCAQYAVPAIEHTEP